mgnify:CR=1 FL=1
MSLRPITFIALLLTASVFPVLNGLAEETPPEDAETRVDNGLKEFGYQAGLAHGCVVDEQQADLAREAVDLHAAVSRLLGTDRAFLFSASFGYGTSVRVETGECAAILKRYEDRVAAFRQGKEQAQ